MPNENEASTTTTTPPSVQTPGTPAPAPAETPPGVTTQADGSHVVPPSAFGKIKDQAFQKGKRAAMSEFEEQLKAAGFSNMGEMFTALAKAKAGTGAPKPAGQTQRGAAGRRQPPPARQPGEDAKAARERQRIERERAELQAQAKTETNRRKRLEQQLQAQQARHQLEIMAIRQGVRGDAVDYAVALILKQIEGKKPEELEKFDEAEAIGALKKSHAFLFGNPVAPEPEAANTGPRSSAPAAAPSPENVANAGAAAAKVDVRKMSPQEYREYMKKRGLAAPA